MIWICPKCGKQNGEVSGICGGCYEMRPAGVNLMPSEAEIAAKEFSESAAPSFWRRMFSLKHRITRTDFGISLALAVAVRMGSLVVRSDDVATGGLRVAIYCLACLALLVAGGKRARDMGYNHWWGVFSTFIVFGIIILLFGRGDKGANQFGSSPRRKAET